MRGWSETTKGKTLASSSPEVRERAVRLVLEGGGEQPAPPRAAPDRRSRPQRWREAVDELVALQAE